VLIKASIRIAKLSKKMLAMKISALVLVYLFYL